MYLKETWQGSREAACVPQGFYDVRTHSGDLVSLLPKYELHTVNSRSSAALLTRVCKCA